jgi:cell division transport system ATP-binding protein
MTSSGVSDCSRFVFTPPYLAGIIDVMIELSQVSVTYRSGEVAALRNISLNVPDGDFVFLVGPTGAGKSTLLKLLYRDVAATSGTLRVAGFDVSTMHSHDIPKLRRKMGIVLQDYGLLPERTVWENIAFACRVMGQSPAEIRRKIPEALEQVSMGHRCDAFPHELSGGEQQRVAIARALINRPLLLVADEPTGNLDPETSAEIMNIFTRANERGATIVIATHDRASVDRLRRRVIAIKDGQKVRDEGTGTYGSEAGN